MKKTLKNFIISLIGFIPLQVYLIKIWLPRFLQKSEGITNLDSRFFYSKEEVSKLMITLGEEGVKLYNQGVVADFFYALFMALLVYSIFKIIRGRKRTNKIIINTTYIIPLIYLLSDWMENVGVLLFINQIDSRLSLVPLFSFFTMIKNLMAMFSLIYLIFLIILRIKNR